MRRYWLLAASLVAATPAFAEPALSTIVVDLRLGDQSLEAMAWRDDDGAIYVDRETLTALRLHADGADDPVALSRVPGLTYREDTEQAAVLITCEARCYARQDLGLRPRIPFNPDSAAGGFLNVDTAATVVDGRTAVAGAFELGLFNAHGFGGTTWTAESTSGDVVRLETYWNFDDQVHRRRVTVGDAISRGGATGVPFRFGGIQIATDFSLDPGFVYFPTPTLNGEAATPSTVDLYVDGVLRLRDRVDAGAFSITNAPVLSGAGTAQIVVTDALGRQQIYAQPFYSSPQMLRQGLSDYSFAAGAERKNFTRASNDYARGFVSGLYRYGVADGLTAEARVEASDDDLYGVGLGASVAAPAFGQIDVGVAASQRDREGYMARAGWYYAQRYFSFGVEAQTASADFERIGDSTAPPARFVGAASLSGMIGDLGSASFAYTVRDDRDAESVRTLGLTYTPARGVAQNFHLSALYFDQTGEAPFLSIGLGFSMQLGEDVTAGAGIEIDRGGASLQGGVQRTADPGGGFGWRTQASVGNVNRLDAGVSHIGATHDASLEASITDASRGVRAQYATALAWVNGEIAAARPVRESFALVDVGVPNTRVMRDNRFAGLTNERGRIILTGLRAYEPNRIGVDLDELPWGVHMESDEIIITPRSRSGAVARFVQDAGGAGETRVIDALGAPLPAGTLLVRESDGARFPVGDDGRVYLTGLSDQTMFTGPGRCVIAVSSDALNDGAPLQCAAS